MKKTKILITIGPSTEPDEVLRKVLPKIDVVRLNFSHSSQEWHKATFEKVKALQKELGDLPFATLADLQGPKIRIGELANPIEFKTGEMIAFTPLLEQHSPDQKIIFVDYPNIHKQIKPGNKILIDNGLSAELEVTEVEGTLVHARVVFGGLVKGRKTVNLPGVFVDLPILTEKDKSDLELALSLDFDYIALSFVRTVEDVMVLRRILDERKSDKKIFVKIEDQFGVDNFEEIMKVADVAIIARGDLGAEVPLEKIPAYQKQMVEICMEQAKPSIIATQMLESMMEKSMPTRAEATDIANAVWQKADCVWLSEESAVGKYPERSVEWMSRILEEAEKSLDYKLPSIEEMKKENDKRITTAAGTIMAEMANAKKIVVMSETGETALAVAAMRPSADIIVFCPNQKVRDQISLAWGIKAIIIDFNQSFDETYEKAKDELKKIMNEGEKFVLISGIHFAKEMGLGVQVKTI